MYWSILRGVAVAALASGLAACHSLQEEKIAIAYQASSDAPAVVPGADKVALAQTR